MIQGSLILILLENVLLVTQNEIELRTRSYSGKKKKQQPCKPTTIIYRIDKKKKVQFVQ